MIGWIYNFAYLCFLLLASPIILYRMIALGKYRQGWCEKFFGRAPLMPDSGKKRVWFHAVSVGEMNLLKPILRVWEVECPDWEVVISTTSKTGMELGRKIFPARTVFYCPLDFTWSVRKAIRRIRPDLLVLVELELWPNLIRIANRCGVKTAIVNGRISDKSYQRYCRIRFLTRGLLRRIDLIAAQDRQAQERFVHLGGSEVVMTGAIKFDGAETNRENAKTASLARLAGIDSNDIVFLAGSTQEPEEEMALATWKSLKGQAPRLKLILVPRHPERFETVADMLNRSGLPWARRTQLETDPSKSSDILLIDTIGELGAWWGTAAIAFVGGSMGSRGGQNMLEPAAYGAAVCFGPNTRNFRDISQMMIRNHAAIVVANENEMTAFVKRCLDDPDWRNQLGSNAKNLVLGQLGATKRTIDELNRIAK